MANITIKKIGFDDMTEVTEISESSKTLIYNNGTAHTASLKTLRQTIKACPTLRISAPEGTTVTISKDDMSYTKKGNSLTFDVPEYGTWSIVATLDGSSITKNMKFDTIKIYTLDIEF